MTVRSLLVASVLGVFLLAPLSASATSVAAQGNCGLIKVGAHHYLVIANSVSCSFAKRTAAKLIPLKPKPLAPGAKTGSLPGPKGYKCIATLGPGNSRLQLNGGCAKNAVPVIQWERAS
jgi:hypothetical protein